MVDHWHSMEMLGCDWMRKAGSDCMCKAVLTAAEDAVRITLARYTRVGGREGPSTECAARGLQRTMI